MLLERLVGNLVQNAVRHNVPGGWVKVETGPGGRVRVTNSGPVVPADQVDGLFEPFRRLAPDRVDSARGVGLGLSIVRSVARAHGGEVPAVRPGRGRPRRHRVAPVGGGAGGGATGGPGTGPSLGRRVIDPSAPAHGLRA